MGAKKLSSSEKAAVVLLSLGEDLASSIVGQMSSDEVRRIGGALSRLGRIDPAVVDDVVAEFHAGLLTQRGGLNGGADSARRLFAKALTPEAAAALGGAVDLTTQMLTETLSHMDAKVLVNYLRREHPQTIALVLAHAPSQQAGAALKLLPPSQHVDLIQRMATLGAVDPEALEAILTSLQAEQTNSRLVQQAPGGVMKIVSLINSLSKDAATRLMDELEERDPVLATQVRQKLVTFDDLRRLGDRAMQAVLAQVPQATLRLSLKEASPEVADHIFKNISERAAKQLRDDVAALPKTRRADVEAAQQQVTDLAQRLAAEGKIEWPGKDDTYI